MFLISLRTYRDYSSKFDQLEFTSGGNPAALKSRIETTMKLSRTSRFEAFVAIVAFGGKAKNPKKVIEKCEEEYKASKQLVSKTVHPALWREVLKIKGST
jgi:hypothetical protein